ncbi:hypothetical protein DPMN_086679 [Dreissena polymorpha]|uniref:Uncharacterized protein n=1 Tax=Dreissena polymorpha TaxID=45954 RepID=A0A9D4KSS4_DREPO|nr:hypothetical protein DPMN_086679 [Dreissena polymorpha]
MHPIWTILPDMWKGVPCQDWINQSPSHPQHQPQKHKQLNSWSSSTTKDELYHCIQYHASYGSSGLMVAGWLRDREVSGLKPALTTGISLSKKFIPPRCINGYL